jgi:hypothetical protein
MFADGNFVLVGLPRFHLLLRLLTEPDYTLPYHDSFPVMATPCALPKKSFNGRGCGPLTPLRRTPSQ